LFYFRNNGKHEETIGSASIPNLNEPSKLRLTFEFGPIKVTSDYWVLETDYNYSLVYSCRTTLGSKNEFAWILSRQRTLNQATIDSLRSKLSSYGVDPNKFLIADQTNC
jgi:lipocalin